LLLCCEHSAPHCAKIRFYLIISSEPKLALWWQFLPKWISGFVFEPSDYKVSKFFSSCCVFVVFSRTRL
jgi:hypothetical protein